MKKLVKESLNEKVDIKTYKFKVKDLIKKLNEFDPEMPVGGEGYYGELLELEDVRLSFMYHKPHFVVLEIEDKGEEPD
jgi:hypothetical protein